MHWILIAALLLLLSPIIAPGRKWLAASFACVLGLGALILWDLDRAFDYCRVTGTDACDWAGWDMMLWTGWAILYIAFLLFRLMLEVIYLTSKDRERS